MQFGMCQVCLISLIMVKYFCMNYDNMFCSAIKDAFQSLVISGCSDYERQLRNDLLVITTLVAQNPEAPIVETGERILII